MVRRHVSAFWMHSFLALSLASCAGSSHRSEIQREAPAGVVYVVFRGWHTDIGLPADEIGGPAGGTLRHRFPGARYLVFGFGERTYYRSSRPAFGDMLLALLPGAGAILVTALNATPAEAFGSGNAVELRLTPSGLDGIARFLSASLERDATGLRRIADGPYPGSEFYATPVTYSAFYTCNTWTAEALRQAGLPVFPTGVLFAGQVMDAGRRLAELQAGEAAKISAASR
jgi:uncharacterized protein (TIGR02117 family)